MSSYQGLELKAFKGIVLVTGPQRSGTTYASEVLARALGVALVNEKAYSTHNVTKFLEMLELESEAVIQCPAMSHLLHRLPRPKTRGVVVFMARDCWDVGLSERRIAYKRSEERSDTWTCSVQGAVGEHLKYANEPELRRWYNPQYPICVVKQLAWRHYQYGVLRQSRWDAVTLDYDSLVDEPTWRNVRNRTSFSAHQTSD